MDLEWMLSAEDDELLEHLGRWYVPRREPRYLRRNALVVLGNVVDPQSDLVERLLDPYLDGDDGLLAGHAAWAALRLGRADLLDRPGRRDRAEIAVEIDRAPAPLTAAGTGIGPAVPVDVLRTPRPDEDGPA